MVAVENSYFLRYFIHIAKDVPLLMNILKLFPGKIKLFRSYVTSQVVIFHVVNYEKSEMTLCLKFKNFLSVFWNCCSEKTSAKCLN